jgi:lipopolysaccharide transport system ATP-binding protein
VQIKKILGKCFPVLHICHSKWHFLEILFQICPTFATGFALPDGQIFTSAYTLFDGIAIERDAQGRGQATVVFNKLPLMKGRFSVGAYLFDERAMHVYDVVLQAATVNVVQSGVHQGFVQLPHSWK